MSQAAFLLAAMFPALVVLAGVRDAATMRIPNWLNLAAAAAFLPAALAAHLSWPLLGLALAFGAGGLVIGMTMFALNWIGGGDAKLFAACGLWLAGASAVPFLLWTALAGGALAMGLLFARRLTASWPVPGPAWLQRLLTEGEGVPYGVAIAVGALMAFPESPVLRALHG
jgi:prepilin peptidase CpaA